MKKCQLLLDYKACEFDGVDGFMEPYTLSQFPYRNELRKNYLMLHKG